MTDLAASSARRSPADFDIDTPLVVAPRAIGRRHDQVPAAPGRRQAHRSRSTSRDTPADADAFCVSTQVGCAMALRVLPDRQDGARSGTSPPAKSPGRCACSPASSDLARSPLQHRPHGHGRAAAQLRRDDEGAADPRRRARAGASSPRRVTLSTVGVLPALERLATEPLMPNLAISLHATTEEQRDLLVPINRKYRLEELLDACRRFPLKRRERITFEYVMLKDVNDTPEDARRLVRLLARHQGQGQPAAAQRGRRDPVRAAVRRHRQPLRADPRRARRHRVGAKVARPRHPRRVRPADYGVVAGLGAGPSPRDGDGAMVR